MWLLFFSCQPVLLSTSILNHTYILKCIKFNTISEMHMYLLFQVYDQYSMQSKLATLSIELISAPDFIKCCNTNS